MSCHILRFVFMLSSVLVFTGFAAPTQDFGSNARNGLIALQKWYNQETGIWNTTGWWNSANCMTVLGDFAAIDPSLKSQVSVVYANSIVAAQNYNPSIAATKVITPEFNILSLHTDNLTAADTKGFINRYYDDEGWWALAWIQAYDVTGNQDYLNMAVSIFNDMQNGTEPNCGGGIWWDKDQTYVNAIANELYLSVAAHLANRIPGEKAMYVNLATTQWTWFQGTGMINSKNLINDGLESNCENNNGTVWSYNQGVILGALVELNKAASNPSYLTSANNIASATIKALTGSAGVLHDPCEPDCGKDGSQFKGIFMRNVQLLQTVAPSNNYLSFIATNAASVWVNSRNDQNQFGVDWAGPAPGTGDAGMQSSAMDSLVAAAAYQKVLTKGIASVGYGW